MLFVFGFITMWGFSSSSYAQPTDLTEEATIYKRISPATVSSILKGMGFEYTENRVEQDHMYYLELGGMTVNMRLRSSGETLELFGIFPMNPPPSLKAINQWNGTQLFSTLFFDDDGDVVIYSPLNLNGGVSRENVKGFIRSFRSKVTTLPFWLRDQKPK